MPVVATRHAAQCLDGRKHRQQRATGLPAGTAQALRYHSMVRGHAVDYISAHADEFGPAARARAPHAAMRTACDTAVARLARSLGIDADVCVCACVCARSCIRASAHARRSLPHTHRTHTQAYTRTRTQAHMHMRACAHSSTLSVCRAFRRYPARHVHRAHAPRRRVGRRARAARAVARLPCERAASTAAALRECSAAGAGSWMRARRAELRCALRCAVRCECAQSACGCKDGGGAHEPGRGSLAAPARRGE